MKINEHLEENNMKFNLSFFRRARVTYEGNPNDPPVKVEFIDSDSNRVVYSAKITPGTWAEAGPRYYVNWIIKVFDDKNNEIFHYKFDLKGKRVYIRVHFPSLGDTIAWFQYIDEFRKKHKCYVITSTYWRTILEPKYPELIFIDHNQVSPYVYATYYLTLGEGGKDVFNTNKNLPRSIPLQQVATDILGLEYAPLRPKIEIPDKPPLIEIKYLTLSEQGFHNIEKLWHRPNAWQELVNMLSAKYKIVVVSKEPTTLKNIIDMTNRPIEETILNIKHSLAFIGVASGPSWLAWALEVPVVMIGGYSEEWHEFECYRVANRDVCNGCYNKRGDQECHNEPKYECSVSITPKMVFDKVMEAIEDKK